MAHRILIADDEPAILRALRRELERDGSLQICGEAHDGAEAVAKAKELRPDLIILDLSMPVMNGIDAARKIKKVLPNVPLLLFTLTDLPQVRAQASSVGIREVVAKSDEIAVLRAAIASALGKQTEAEPTVVAAGPSSSVSDKGGAIHEVTAPVAFLGSPSEAAETLEPVAGPDDLPPEMS
jgi:two-component system, NarL family, nitrate/nitrite response regulator NarL